MFSQRKLNTYGVEPPCERLPRVGSFLANPGLSKEQHLRRCIVTTFTMIDAHVGILAQHWRPYVTRGFNAIGVEFSLRKHGYSEGIYGGLRLESVTPMALKCSIRNMNYVMSRQKIWWITPKKRNTYGVVPRTTYANPG